MRNLGYYADGLSGLSLSSSIPLLVPIKTDFSHRPAPLPILSAQSAKKTPRREEDNTRGTPQQPGPQMLTDGTDTGRQPGGPLTRSSEQNSKVLCMTHHITATGRISILPFQTTLRDETSAFRRSTMTRPPPRGSNTRLPIRFSSGFCNPRV